MLVLIVVLYCIGFPAILSLCKLFPTGQAQPVGRKIYHSPNISISLAGVVGLSCPREQRSAKEEIKKNKTQNQSGQLIHFVIYSVIK